MENVEKFERDKLKKLFELLHNFLYKDFTSEQQSISLSMVDLSTFITDTLCKGSLNEDGQPIEIPTLFREQLLHTVTSWLLLPVIERYQYNALIWMRNYIMASYPAHMQQRITEADAIVANARKSQWLRLHSEHQQRRTGTDSRKKAMANLITYIIHTNYSGLYFNRIIIINFCVLFFGFSQRKKKFPFHNSWLVGWWSDEGDGLNELNSLF